MPKNKKLLDQLNLILEMELSGVPRYLHYALMARGPGRIPIVKFFQDQATESLNHALIIGEKITALGGHPSMRVTAVKETNQHATIDLLKEGLEHEHRAVALYKATLKMIDPDDVALDELIREFVRTEQEHVEEVEKMIQPSNK